MRKEISGRSLVRVYAHAGDKWTVESLLTGDRFRGEAPCEKSPHGRLSRAVWLLRSSRNVETIFRRSAECTLVIPVAFFALFGRGSPLLIGRLQRCASGRGSPNLITTARFGVSTALLAFRLSELVVIFRAGPRALAEGNSDDCRGGKLHVFVSVVRARFRGCRKVFRAALRGDVGARRGRPPNLRAI